jgi:hypothetical protein
MGSPRLIRQVTIDAGASAGDYARSYEVHTSTDGVNWGAPAATVTGALVYSSARFSPRTARYVRVRLTAGFGLWWSVHELHVYD